MANRLIKPRKFRSSKELKKDLKVPKSDSKGKSPRTAADWGLCCRSTFPQPG